MTIQLIDIACPECDAVNWLNNGDVSDLTVRDIEAVQCFSCGHEWWIDDRFESIHDMSMEPADGYIVEGKRTARECLE